MTTTSAFKPKVVKPKCFGGALCPDADAWERCRSERPDVCAECERVTRRHPERPMPGWERDDVEVEALTPSPRCVRFGEWDEKGKMCRTCNRWDKPACVIETRRRGEARAAAERERLVGEMEGRRAGPEATERQREYAVLMGVVDVVAREVFGRGVDELRFWERRQLPPFCQAEGRGLMCSRCGLQVVCGGEEKKREEGSRGAAENAEKRG